MSYIGTVANKILKDNRIDFGALDNNKNVESIYGDYLEPETMDIAHFEYSLDMYGEGNGVTNKKIGTKFLINLGEGLSSK